MSQFGLSNDFPCNSYFRRCLGLNGPATDSSEVKLALGSFFKRVVSLTDSVTFSERSRARSQAPILAAADGVPLAGAARGPRLNIGRAVERRRGLNRCSGSHRIFDLAGYARRALLEPQILRRNEAANREHF